jgi:hypothetical protein
MTKEFHVMMEAQEHQGSSDAEKASYKEHHLDDILNLALDPS